MIVTFERGRARGERGEGRERQTERDTLLYEININIFQFFEENANQN